MARSKTLSYKVTGTNEAVRKFRGLGFKVSDLSGVFSEIAAEAAADAKALAPKRTGRLAGDIRAGHAKTRATIIDGRASVPYAGPINYGWPRHNIAASLFMNKAADSKADSSADRINSEIKRLIRRSGLG